MVKKSSKKNLNKNGKKISKYSKKSVRRNIKRKNLTKKMRGGVPPTLAERQALVMQAVAQSGVSSSRNNPNIFGHGLEYNDDSGMGSSISNEAQHTQERRSTFVRQPPITRRKMTQSLYTHTPINSPTLVINTSSDDTIKHMWFTNWPDHGVPANMVDFDVFITDVYNDMKNGGNTVIHCSAGVGRTGVVYVVLKLLSEGNVFEQIKDKTNRDLLKERIDNIIIQERQHRNKSFVQAAIQYNFIYKYFTNADIVNNYDEEFKKLNSNTKICVSPNPEKIKMTGKNRWTDMLPCESKRVSLNDGTYISASIMTSLIVNGHEIKIIAAQCPIQSTIKDFYQMLEDKKIKRIIMVTNFIEKGMAKCDNYFGSGLAIGEEINPAYTGSHKYVTLIEPKPTWGQIRLISSKPILTLTSSID